MINEMLEYLQTCLDTYATDHASPIRFVITNMQEAVESPYAISFGGDYRATGPREISLDISMRGLFSTPTAVTPKKPKKKVVQEPNLKGLLGNMKKETKTSKEIIKELE